MGEAEAPAPPPAVPQNPIKIFISGNSGNKEVSLDYRVTLGLIGGLIRVYRGAFWAVACPRTATLLEPGQKLSPHFLHPRFLSIFPLSFLWKTFQMTSNSSKKICYQRKYSHPAQTALVICFTLHMSSIKIKQSYWIIAHMESMNSEDLIKEDRVGMQE